MGFKFFDINYLEYASITGTNLDTSSADYIRDNRSDAGYTSFLSTTGELVADFGSGTYYYVKDFFINNCNWKTGYVAVYTGTAWDTISSFTNLTVSSYFYSHGTTITAYDVKFGYTATQDSLTGYCGELIATLEKFELNHNPSSFEAKINYNGSKNTLWNGRTVWVERDNYFNASMDWNYLIGDLNSMTGTDLDNITELSRKKGAFLFWANGDDSGMPDIRPWREEDVYKCRILDAVAYSPSRSNLLAINTFSLNMDEVN